jgi:PIN domain nuclease of toxin-antitoxin system
LRLLIDSNAFIWMVAQPAELSANAREALANPDNERVLSLIAIWEIAIKLSLRKLVLPGDLMTAVEGMAAVTLPVQLAHIARVQHLPFHHRDPFDRMMIAQALEENLTIVTRDRAFRAYGVPLIAA